MSAAAKLIAERAAARKDPALHVAGAPAGYRLGGVSSLVRPDGSKVLQWIKTTKEAEQAASILEAFREAIATKPIPKRARIPAPKAADRDLLAVYPMGDPHFGMLAWPAETGNEFNLTIARAHLTAAMTQLVGLMPPAETALVINLGDMLHADSGAATTTKGTRVDVDSRWPKMLQVACETLIVCVELALRKHKRVRMVNVRGNHDDLSAVVIAQCMAAHFRNNPRVEIDTDPSAFHFHEFGAVLLGTTHGHTVKAKDLPGVMATDQAAAWGRTEHRMWYTGHVHHERAIEYPGCVVETFRTLAAKDAWHHGQGYRARRGMVADVWHREHGKVLRHEIGVGRLDAVPKSRKGK